MRAQRRGERIRRSGTKKTGKRSIDQIRGGGDTVTVPLHGIIDDR